MIRKIVSWALRDDFFLHLRFDQVWWVDNLWITLNRRIIWLMKLRSLQDFATFPANQNFCETCRFYSDPSTFKQRRACACWGRSRPPKSPTSRRNHPAVVDQSRNRKVGKMSARRNLWERKSKKLWRPRATWEWFCSVSVSLPSCSTPSSTSSSQATVRRRSTQTRSISARRIRGCKTHSVSRLSVSAKSQDVDVATTSLTKSTRRTTETTCDCLSTSRGSETRQQFIAKCEL